jgi:hypothetical protein
MREPLPGSLWSPQDILAHVGWYEYELGAMLQAGPAHRDWVWNLAEDARNTILYHEQRVRSLAAIRAAAQSAFTHLVRAIAALNRAAGPDPTRFPPMPAGWTPWQFIAVHSYEHYRAHTPALRAWLDTQPAPAPRPAPVGAG